MNEPTQVSDVTAANAGDEARRRLYAARELLIEATEIHSRFCRDPGCLEGANTLAFLAHSIGVRAAELRAFPRLLVRYELNCECSRCKP